MSKAADTYSARSSKERRRRPARRVAGPSMRERTKAFPKWVPAVAAISLTVMVCLTINFRAFSELREETDQNKTLTLEIEKKTTENLAIQEEIHYLKNDPKTIEREAKKLGLIRKKEKVPVPASK